MNKISDSDLNVFVLITGLTTVRFNLFPSSAACYISPPGDMPGIHFCWRPSRPQCYSATGRINHLTPNDPYMGRIAPLTYKRCILYIYSTNIGTEYFKHAVYSPFFSLQNAVCFIMLTCLVPVLFTFYIQDVLELKKNNSGAKRLSQWKLPMAPLGIEATAFLFVAQCPYQLRHRYPLWRLLSIVEN